MCNLSGPNSNSSTNLHHVHDHKYRFKIKRLFELYHDRSLTIYSIKSSVFSQYSNQSDLYPFWYPLIASKLLLLKDIISINKRLTQIISEPVELYAICLIVDSAQSKTAAVSSDAAQFEFTIRASITIVNSHFRT